MTSYIDPHKYTIQGLNLPMNYFFCIHVRLDRTLLKCTRPPYSTHILVRAGLVKMAGFWPEPKSGTALMYTVKFHSGMATCLDHRLNKLKMPG